MARTPQEEARLKRIAYEFQHGKPDGIELNLSLKLDMIDTIALSPEQTRAILIGVAQCIAAGNAPARECGDNNVTQELSSVLT